MSFIELNEGKPLNVVEAILHSKAPTPGGPLKWSPVEMTKIRTVIFTDGEIEKECDEKIEKTHDYYINGSKYNGKIDTVKTKNIYFKNHSYVITYLIAEEFRNTGRIAGSFDVIKDVSIYLNDVNDMSALREAKQVIKQIEKSNRSVDFPSLFSMCFGPRKEIDIEPKKISKNIYTLKRTR